MATKIGKVLSSPSGISVDYDGYVYVVGKSSRNVVVLSADGQQHKELLTVNSILNPYSLVYNRMKNQLIVARLTDVAMIFNFT